MNRTVPPDVDSGNVYAVVVVSKIGGLSLTSKTVMNRVAVPVIPLPSSAVISTWKCGVVSKSIPTALTIVANVPKK